MVKKKPQEQQRQSDTHIHTSVVRYSEGEIERENVPNCEIATYTRTYTHHMHTRTHRVPLQMMILVVGREPSHIDEEQEEIPVTRSKAAAAKG